MLIAGLCLIPRPSAMATWSSCRTSSYPSEPNLQLHVCSAASKQTIGGSPPSLEFSLRRPCISDTGVSVLRNAPLYL